MSRSRSSSWAARTAPRTARGRWASTGRPADTGVLQVTAIARTGLQAEVRAKTALLVGPERIADTLTAGGVYVTADGRICVVEREHAALRA